MKIQITQTHLSRALGILSRVASTRTPLPILSNILIRASGGKLELAATNLEVAIVCTVSGKIEEEGSVTIPARLLYDFVSQLPKELTINLVFDDMKLFISAGSYSSHIQGVSAEEFPALPKISKGTSLKISSEKVKSALDKTMLAASRDETRPILGGVYFHSTEGALYTAATDGYRLAEARLTETKDEINAVVPASTLQDVLKIVQEVDDDDVTLQFDEGQFGVSVNDIQLISRLVDGQYPAYQQLIPEQSDIQFTVNRAEFLTAAKLAGLFARESGGSINLKVSEDEKSLTVSSIASQVGDNSSSLSGEVIGSGEVVLNVRYLTDALNCFNSDNISFRFSGSISPCVLTADSQEGYQHIVMPLKN